MGAWDGGGAWVHGGLGWDRHWGVYFSKSVSRREGNQQV